MPFFRPSTAPTRGLLDSAPRDNGGLPQQVGEQLAADGYVVLVAGWIVQINASQSVVWSVA